MAHCLDEETRRDLSRTINEIEMSVRSYNSLKTLNIGTIGELVQKTEEEMLNAKNFGRVSLRELKEILDYMGLYFGMKFLGYHL